MPSQVPGEFFWSQGEKVVSYKSDLQHAFLISPRGALDPQHTMEPRSQDYSLRPEPALLSILPLVRSSAFNSNPLWPHLTGGNGFIGMGQRRTTTHDIDTMNLIHKQNSNTFHQLPTLQSITKISRRTAPSYNSLAIDLGIHNQGTQCCNTMWR